MWGEFQWVPFPTKTANFSGMEVSVLRLRSSTLWARGANFGSFDIPPRIITMPYVKRLAIMYENLGNLSSHYYDLPGFKFLTAVVGLVIYDATDVSETKSPKRLNIALMGKSIRVRFDHVQVPKGRNSSLLKCIRFEPTSGPVELSDVVSHGVCSSKGLGHFAIAIPIVNSTTLSPPHSPSPSPSPLASPTRRARRRLQPWTWWVVGISAGVVGFILVVSISIPGYRAFASRKIRRMESKSEKAESLDTRWIGDSKLPWATMTRTQAVNLETDSVP
ncbi:hypothetical protein Cgig2_000512 [Carnegiea gigantea]|uniref:Uncharacterized protein n=1 Tax=Carnegiea gigantea TaxID=171969 RepID=A0A9Q1JNN4_9CARY|nr:hypothetical protein Cgig2_000512 [Carnegiea gigantea]